MTLPAFLLAVLFATLYGSLYHLVRGGDWRRLLLYLGMAWAGFFAGHWFASGRGWFFLMLGPIDLGGGTVGSYLFLGLGDWITRSILPRPPEV